MTLGKGVSGSSSAPDMPQRNRINIPTECYLETWKYNLQFHDPLFSKGQ